MDLRQDVIRRLEAADVAYYVTGSEAMAVHGIAYRSTNDIDIVLGIDPGDYDGRIRSTFEPDYLVNDLIRIPPRSLGGAVGATGIGKADFILRDPAPWPASAMDRRIRVDDPDLGAAWVSTPEDLIIAKLEWAHGDLDGLQGRDIARIIQTQPTLDWAYLRSNAAMLQLEGVLDEARRRA